MAEVEARLEAEREAELAAERERQAIIDACNGTINIFGQCIEEVVEEEQQETNDGEEAECLKTNIFG